MRRFYFLIGLLLLSLTLPAQNTRVSATADKSSILIGEQVHLKLELKTGASQEIPFFSIDSFAHFEIIDRSKIDTIPSANGLTLSQTLVVTSWDSGHWQIPAFVAGRSKTSPIGIDVGYTALAPNQPYHDIKEILDVKPPEESNWYWYLAGLALLLVLFLLFFPTGKTKKEEPKPMVEDKDAYSRAMKKIDQLKKQPSRDPKVYYTQLVDIFREYLEKRKNIHSFSQTTEDLSRQLKQLSMPEARYREMVTTLSLSDMVKFARYLPAEEENAYSTETIKQSIVAIENLK